MSDSPGHLPAHVPAHVPAGAGALHVTVAFAPAARQVLELSLQLPAGATVQDALNASGLLGRYSGLCPLGAGDVGVWGRPAGAAQLLRAGDRVEIWRPLQADPKVARRERFGRQGARTAGLFAQRRPGAKPGY